MTTTAIGKPLPRVDGRAKVTGGARYAADFNQQGQAHAVIVGATVGLGRVTGIDTAPVQILPGVIAVISHLNAPRLAYRPHKSFIDPAVGERLHVLQDDRVRFYGQPVAVVVAETLDQAERAAVALKVTFAAEQPVVDPLGPKAGPVVPEAATRPGARIEADKSRGDADQALRNAAVRIEAVYDIARENHNPMEPHATVAVWDGSGSPSGARASSSSTSRLRSRLSSALRPSRCRSSAPLSAAPSARVSGLGRTSRWRRSRRGRSGARSSSSSPASRCSLRPATGPRTLQRIALGATSDGKLTSMIHEGTGETSRYEEFIEALTVPSSFMYSCPNVRTRYRLVPLDTGTPNHMRGPGEASGIFALECALDELSYALGIDPVELRRRNEPEIDEGDNKPFSSRSLLKCYDVAADRFGWSRRDPVPRAMRDGRLLIGMGMASATYPSLHSPASARVRLLPEGIAEVEVAASDMGPGTYTSMTQVSADMLGVPVERIRFSLGRSDFPPAPPHGGSQTMASVGSAIRAACLAVQEVAARRAVADQRSPVFGAALDGVEWHEGRLRRRGDSVPGQPYGDIVSSIGLPIEASASAQRDPELARRYSMHSFGAVFVEVAIDPDVGTIGVRRAVGAYGIGRVVNPRLASSQCTGGMIGGIGMALMERTVLDRRDGRPVNAHMADYLVPVNLDTPHLEAHFVDEVDPHVNPLGVKGLGEIALVGMAPAVANAVFHATGKRVRTLPIRIEDVLEA